MENLYTRKQIAVLINKTPGYVGMYVKRKGLIEEDRKIDINHPINKSFIAKFTTKDANKQIEESLKPDQNKTKDELSSNINPSNVDYVKKQHEILKLKSETRLKNLELEKKKAKVLPLDFVIEWSSLNIRGVFGETVNFGNTIIEQMCNELDADIKTKLIFKKKFKQGFNEILKEGIKSQKPDAIAQAKEYSLLTKW